MNKEYAIVKVHTFFGTTVTIMNKKNFGSTVHQIDVMFESDKFSEIENYYENYKEKCKEITHV